MPRYIFTVIASVEANSEDDARKLLDLTNSGTPHLVGLEIESLDDVEEDED